MTTTWPRLSETLSPAVSLVTCQNCGIEWPDTIERWREHDVHDRPERIIILLCTTCSSKIIEPHPRLYAKLDRWEPMPGSMLELCGNCRYRSGTRCTHPDLTVNGGPGLQVTFPQPIRALVDGTRNGRRTGWMQVIWEGPPTACAGKPE